MEVMRVVYGRLPYELTIVELQPAETVERDGYLIAAVPVRHRGGSSFGYALVEEPRPGHLDAAWPSSWGSGPGPTSDGCSAGRPSRG